MNKEKYFIIFNSEGDTHVEELTKQELENRLNEKYYGDIDFLNKISDTDTNYWFGKTLIIKGEILKPQKKEVITKFKL